MLRQDPFLEGAQDLARQIWERRLHASDGSVTWQGPGNPPPGAPIRMAPVGPHLYGGTTGIALFLAALENVTGSGQYREPVLQILSPLRRKLGEILADPARASSLSLGIGGLVGLGSFLYGLLRIGRWLEEPELVEEARNLLPLFTGQRIDGDDACDVIAGSAGAILALLALGGEAPLHLASLCGRHLLCMRSQTGGWRTLPGHPPLTGFAHGAAGISHALLRLYERTGDPELREAAEEGIAFEREAYSPEHRNWRDLRSPEPFYMSSWCYGAPGIALGRLGNVHTLDSPEIWADIQNALDNTRSLPLTIVDHICCGNLGRAEVLLYASKRLGDTSLLDAARDLALRVLRRAEAQGGFGWVHEPRADFFDPSLFTGAAGAGYTLLRLRDPSTLHCLPLLD